MKRNYQNQNIQHSIVKIIDLVLMSIIIALIGYYFYDAFCGFVFTCHCTFCKNKQITEKNCNIHNVHGAKCPYCNSSPWLHLLISPGFIITLMCIHTFGA